MGYYATIDYGINKVKVENKEELIEALNKIDYDYSSENLRVIFNECGYIEDFEFEEWYCKWYESDEFAKILSDYIKEGSIDLSFVGEDGEMWGYKIYPNLVIEFDSKWQEEYAANELLKLLENSSAPQPVKNEVKKEYKTYWEDKLKQAQNNLNMMRLATV